MNEEIQLKIQAHMDGEVSGRESRDLVDLLGADRNSQLLAIELRFVKEAMAGNELSLKLPEPREFYWSKIAREIERIEAKPESSRSVHWWKPGFVRYIGGFAAATALLMISFLAFNQSSFTPGEQDASGDMGAITYHSDTEQMTVVYLFDRQQEQVSDLDQVH